MVECVNRLVQVLSVLILGPYILAEFFLEVDTTFGDQHRILLHEIDTEHDRVRSFLYRLDIESFTRDLFDRLRLRGVTESVITILNSVLSEEFT
jgi:hypothetical protein